MSATDYQSFCLNQGADKIKPLISVVLATKGTKPILLENCLNSLMNQTFKNFEVILVYSKFPDELGDLINKGNFAAIKERGSTLGSARNLGVRNSNSKIIVFIDDDAEAPNDWLSKIYKSFEKTPSLFCLGGPNLTPIAESKKQRLSYVHGAFMESRMGKKIAINKYAVGKIAGCNVAYRKEAFERIGYLNEKLKSGEDWDFHLRLAENGYSLKFDPDIPVWHHRQGLRHVFWNSSRMVPFFFSWLTLKYSKYESFFASFYLTNLTFLFLLIFLFISPFAFCLFLIFVLIAQFLFAAIRTKTYGKNAIYYPFQIMISLTQIFGFYFGIIKTLIFYLREKIGS